jgi:hypothetical protein
MNKAEAIKRLTDAGFEYMGLVNSICASVVQMSDSFMKEYRVAEPLKVCDEAIDILCEDKGKVNVKKRFRFWDEKGTMMSVWWYRIGSGQAGYVKE